MNGRDVVAPSPEWSRMFDVVDSVTGEDACNVAAGCGRYDDRGRYVE